MKILSSAPDLILFGGSIFTADEAGSVCEALAVKDGKVLASGSDEEILPLAGENTELADLKGRSAMPGINDCHSHLWQSGLMLRGVTLFGIDSFDGLKAALKEKVKAKRPGEWIYGASYIESQFRENRPFTKREMDEVSPQNPAVFDRVFGACVANSAALEAAGISADTPDPPNGEILRDPETGEPNGILRGDAQLLVKSASDEPLSFGESDATLPDSFWEELIISGMNAFSAFGITSITEAGLSDPLIRAYHRIHARGELRIRTAIMPIYYGFDMVQNDAEIEARIKSYRFRTGYGNDMLRYTGLKMAIDYGLTSGTALKSWAYVGDDGPRQVPLRLDMDKLESYIKQVHDDGWDIGIHVMGDIACDRAVDAIYKAVKANPRPHRHSVIHAYFPTPQAIEKMREAGILHIAQGSFIYGEADGYPELLPKEQMDYYTPLRTLTDSGITVGLSSDVPCGALNPFWNMYSAVTRKAMRGTSLGDAERISVKEAVRMMTYSGAVLSGEEDAKGSLEPGKLADIAVLDRSLDGIDPEDIRNVRVTRTILGGRTVYRL